MRNLLRKLFAPTSTSQPDLLALQSEIQRLRLALDEAAVQRKRLEDELARQQGDSEARRTAALARILTDLAAPAAQFMLQLDLTDRQGKTLQSADTLAVARSLVKTLATHGLQPAETAGETQPFNPEHHAPLASGAAILPGQPVLIRTPGFTFQGRRLLKAGVSLLEP